MGFDSLRQSTCAPDNKQIRAVTQLASEAISLFINELVACGEMENDLREVAPDILYRERDLSSQHHTRGRLEMSFARGCEMQYKCHTALHK